MGVQVTFDYATWIAQYPEFSTTVDSTQAGIWFGVAETLHRNDGIGPVSTATTQTNMLNAVLAHLCFLFLGTNTQPPAQVVGHIDSAAEGSVNVAMSYGDNVSDSEAFWIQSKYGAMYWQMTNPYRRMRYLPGQSFGAPNPFLYQRGPNWWRS